MCWDGKCLFCIKVETGTLIFAIINVVGAALSTLASIILLIVFNVVLETAAKKNVMTFLQMKYGVVNSAHVVASTVGNIVLGVQMLVILVHFTFSILLADGICKKVTSKIKAYFIYGVIVNVFWYIVIIMGVWANSGSFKNVFLLLLIIQLIYTSILVMIHMTYQKINKGAVYVHGHQQEKHYKIYKA